MKKFNYIPALFLVMNSALGAHLTGSLEKLDTKPQKTWFKGNVSYWGNQVDASEGEVPGNSQLTDFSLNYEDHSRYRATKVFNAKARLNDENQLMFSVPEAYVGLNRERHHLGVGRIILDWSVLDKEWGFGSLNNRVNFDQFQPGQEGLTGLHYRYKSPFKVNVDVFASSVYLPEMNPGTEFNKDEGEIVCRNPWCQDPGSEVPITDDVTYPIFYNVNYPETDDVVFRYSVGGQLSYIGENVGLKVFGMRKPENQMSTSLEIFAQPDQQRVFVDITPEVYYHDVVGGSLELYYGERLKFHASALGIYPEQFPDGSSLEYIEYVGIKPEKVDEEYLGGGLTLSWNRFQIGASYIARVSSYDQTDNLLAEAPRWNQAYHLTASARLWHRLSVSTDLKFDTITGDRLYMYQAGYLVGDSVTISAGANIIGTDSEDSFWAKYENNDSVYGMVNIRY